MTRGLTFLWIAVDVVMAAACATQEVAESTAPEQPGVSKTTRAEKAATAKELNRQPALIDPDNPSGSVRSHRSSANAAQRSWGDPRGVLADDTRPKVVNPRN